MATTTESTDASAYERLKDAVEGKGEVMIRIAGGETLELHKHNVTFEERPWARVEADDETHWLDLSEVSHYWTHEEI